MPPERDMPTKVDVGPYGAFEEDGETSSLLPPGRFPPPESDVPPSEPENGGHYGALPPPPSTADGDGGEAAPDPGGDGRSPPPPSPSKSPSSRSYRPWLYPFYFNIFFACSSFSIVMPSLAPYLERMGSPLSFLPWVVSGYALGEMGGSVLFGWYYEWSARSLPPGMGPRSSLVGCVVVGVIGSAAYAAADWADSPSLVLWARVVQGVWTGGQQTVEQAYLSAAVGSEDRVELTATLSTFAVLGFVVGPSFGAALSGIDAEVWGLRIDAYNAPGLFILATTLAMLANSAFRFDGMDDRTCAVGTEIDKGGGRGTTEKGDAEAGGACASDDDDDGDAAAGTADSDARRGPRNYAGMCVCVFLFFVHYYSFAVQETITTPLVIRLYGWDPLRVNLLFVFAGVLSLITSVAITYLSRVVEDRSMLLFSVAVGLVGSALLVDSPGADENWDSSLPYAEADPADGAAAHGASSSPPDHPSVSVRRFLLGFSLITIAFPFGRNVTLGVFGNVLGPVNQGRWMGLMLAVSAVPRALGPFSAVSALQVVGWRTWVEFGAVSALFAAGMISAVAALHRLVPYEEWRAAAAPAAAGGEDEKGGRRRRVGGLAAVSPHSPMPHNGSPAAFRRPRRENAAA